MQELSQIIITSPDMCIDILSIYLSYWNLPEEQYKIVKDNAVNRTVFFLIQTFNAFEASSVFCNPRISRHSFAVWYSSKVVQITTRRGLTIDVIPSEMCTGTVCFL